LSRQSIRCLDSNGEKSIPGCNFTESVIYYRTSLGDRHSPLGDGIIDMKALLTLVEELTPNTTVAIEYYDPECSVQWL